MVRKTLKPSHVRESEKPLNNFKVVWDNFKAYKMATLNEEATYKDACRLLEAVKVANAKGIYLKEAEIPTSKSRIQEDAMVPPQEPGPQQVEQPTEPPMEQPAEQANVPVDVQQQITALQNALDALKAAAGLEVNDLGAAPNSDVPPVTGQNPEGVADATNPAPEMNVAQPVLEALESLRAEGVKIDEATFKKVMAEKGSALLEKVGERSDRIAYRDAKLDVMNEHYKGDIGKAYLTHLGYLKESKDDWDYIPTEEQLAKGYASGPAASEIKPAKTWPTKAMPASETKDLKKTNESAEEPVAKTSKISESEVTNRYVDDYFSKKLDFNSLKESMKNGLLG